MGDPTPMSLLSERMGRLEDRIEDVEGDVEAIDGLRREVGLLREDCKRNTNALYTAAISLLATGVLTVVTALIVKGVIG